MTAPPRPTSRTSSARFRTWTISGSILVVLLLSGSVATADSRQAILTAGQPATPSVAAEKSVPAKKSARARPLRPQTRYTVRKQIESIRPTEWLASYGRVKVREVSR